MPSQKSTKKSPVAVIDAQAIIVKQLEMTFDAAKKASSHNSPAIPEAAVEKLQAVLEESVTTAATEASTTDEPNQTGAFTEQRRSKKKRKRKKRKKDEITEGDDDGDVDADGEDGEQANEGEDEEEEDDSVIEFADNVTGSDISVIITNNKEDQSNERDRTHAVIINLDDKSRFTDEVTV